MKHDDSVPAGEFASVAASVKLGKGVKLGKFINLYGCEIGDESKIGAFVEIQKNAAVIEAYLGKSTTPELEEGQGHA